MYVKMMYNVYMYAVYIRASTEHQSLDMQRVAIEAFLKESKISDAIFYEEIATGTNTRRPQFQRLLTDLRLGKISTIVTYKLDRLFRSLRDLVITLKELEELKINFVSVQDRIDLTTPSGRLMVHLLGSFAEFEASIIRERVRCGLNAARAKGKRLGRPKIFDDRSIFDLRGKGLSYREISNRLGVSKSLISKTLNRWNVNKQDRNLYQD